MKIKYLCALPLFIYSSMPLNAMQAPAYRSREHITNTLKSLGKGDIDLDTALDTLLPPETVNKIVRHAYKEDFNSFFSAARLWIGGHAITECSASMATEEQKACLKPLPETKTDQFNQFNPELQYSTVMQYGDEILLASTENDVFFCNTKLNIGDGYAIGPTDRGKIVYLYKNIHHHNNNFITIGWHDGSITIANITNRKHYTLEKIAPSAPTFITTWDNNTKWLVAANNECIMFGFLPTIFTAKTVYHYKNSFALSHPIKNVGFYKNNKIIQADDDTILSLYPCSETDAQTLKYYTFSPQQASLIYRLIEHHNKKTKPLVPQEEQAIFASLSPLFQEILTNTEGGAFKYTCTE